jgi:uncharacterized protein
MAAAAHRLSEHIGSMDQLVVAFSGGVDSTFLAHVATQALGPERVLCVTASSASMAAADARQAASLAELLGLQHQIVETEELDDPRYVANNPDRCAWCKTHLMDALEPLARARAATVVLGVNVDDLGDHRPGQAVAEERGARFPLVEVGMTKRSIREASAALGLPTAEKPASPCLASRLPYGTPVTIASLSAIERAESAIKALGFADLRVRHHGDVALVEVPEACLADAMASRADIVEACRDAGYAFCALDLEGLASGRLNRVVG